MTSKFAEVFPRWEFKPWTHWHQVTESCYQALLKAGYGPDQLREVTV